MAKSRRSGPKLTDPPHLIAIRARLEKLGHGSLKEAAARGRFGYDSFLRIIRQGLASDPKQSTVDRLKDLGIFDLVPKKTA
jgi:hypothetical protein